MADKPTGADWDAMKDRIRKQQEQAKADRAAERRSR